MKALNINTHNGIIMTIITGNKEWFKAKDIGKMIGFKNTTYIAKRYLKNGEAKVFTSKDFPELRLPNRGFLFLDTTAVLELIKALKAFDTEFAQIFQSKIIPKIRKNKDTKNINSKENNLTKTKTLLQDIIETPSVLLDLIENYKKIKMENELLKKELEQLKTKTSQAMYNLTDAAKILGLKPKVFIKLLEENKFIYRNSSKQIRPYADKVPEYLQLKKFVNKKTNAYGAQTMITDKGIEAIERLISEQ